MRFIRSHPTFFKPRTLNSVKIPRPDKNHLKTMARQETDDGADTKSSEVVK